MQLSWQAQAERLVDWDLLRGLLVPASTEGSKSLPPGHAHDAGRRATSH